MSNLQVITIPILPMGMINAFLIVQNENHVLVDSGVPGSEEKISKVLKRYGLGFRDIDLIIITHAHGDHAGSAYAVQQLSGAPILAHEGDLPYFQREKPMTFCPTGWVGRAFIKFGDPGKPLDAFTPDILLKNDDVFDLSEHGVNGTVIFTPGHTEGSLSVTLSNKEVLASDLVASGILLGGIICKGRAKPPPFEENPHQVVEELDKLLRQGMETFYLGHGGPLPAKEVRRYIDQFAG